MPPIQKRAVMPSKHASKVWKYYGDNLDGEFSHCLLCKYHPTRGGEVHIKVNNGSTTAMRNHLKSHHWKEFLDMEAEESTEKAKKSKAPLGLKKDDNTPKIPDVVNRMVKVDPCGAKQSNYDKKLLEFSIFKIQLVELGNIPYLFNIQITAHLFHGRLHLNIRICCNYPEISSGRLLLNDC